MSYPTAVSTSHILQISLPRRDSARMRYTYITHHLLNSHLTHTYIHTYTALAIYPSPLLAILLCAWSCVVILCDEHMICPQLIHFVFASVAICFDSLDHLRMYTMLLYSIGGLQKLNVNFCTHGWLNFFRDFLYIQFGWFAPQRTSFVFGMSAAIFEAMAGILLCFPGTSAWAAFCLILLHVVILVAVGPLGSNSFQPIWPWNVLCIILLFHLFIHERNEDFVGIPDLNSSSLENFVLSIEIGLFVFAPILSWFERWPPNLSFQMHSYNFANVRMHICGEEFPLYGIALYYQTQPSLTLRGFSMWAQHLADVRQRKVEMSYQGRPECMSGKRYQIDLIFKPSHLPSSSSPPSQKHDF
jgi:uncharacterized membrane protein YphA (DoxX/SURF4 family)